MLAFARDGLNPIFYLCSQVVKTAIWVGLTVFAIYGTLVLDDLWLVDDDSAGLAEQGLPALGIAAPAATV